MMVCAGSIRSTLLLLPTPCVARGSSEVAVEFFGLLYLFVQNLPQLRMHAVIFSPI